MQWKPTGKAKSKKEIGKEIKARSVSSDFAFLLLPLDLGQTPGIAFFNGFRIANNTTAITSAMQDRTRKKLD